MASVYASSPVAQAALQSRIGASVGQRGEQAREQVLLQRPPGVGVAEERRDVDEQGVEQLRELAGVDLEVVAVGVVGLEWQACMRRPTSRMRLARL